MSVSVINVRGEHEFVEYGPYEEDAARKNALLSEWAERLIARLQMPWFMPRLRRVERAIAEVAGRRLPEASK